MFDCNPVAIAAGFLNACNSDSFLLIMLLSEKINSKIVLSRALPLLSCNQSAFFFYILCYDEKVKDKYLFQQAIPRSF